MSNSYALIDWLDAKCRTWGYDRRRLRRAKWPPSISGKLDEPIGYGAIPEPAEGLTGDALLVAVAIRRALEDHAMSERQHIAIYLQYDDRYRRMPARSKCTALKVTRQGYYYILSHALRKLDAYWPTDLEARMDTAQSLQMTVNSATKPAEWREV